MAKYLDPKNDLLFKKVFGEHKHLCISLINSLLKFKGDAQVEWIEYDTTELVPEVPTLKDSIVDVRCKDKTGREFIVEMQMDWTKDFEQRVVFNASKLYVRQVKRGDELILPQPVYSLNLVNDIFEKDPTMKDEYYHHYKIVNVEHTHKQIKGLEFVFIELPKFKPSSQEEQGYLNLWLRFLTEINEGTKVVPAELLRNKELSDAIDCVEEASLTEEERKKYERIKDIIWKRRLLIEGKWKEGHEEGREEGREEGIAEGIEIGEARGIEIGEARGIEIGEARGIEIGEERGVKQERQNMLELIEKGYSLDEIKKILSKEEQ